jgi:hypothetical protein
MIALLLRAFVALLVIVGAGEVFVRVVLNGPSPQVYDPEIGYRYLPHNELFQAKEGYNRFQFNALGLNDDELTPADGRCRLLVVGDSYTTALQVPRAENFTSIAEALNPRLDVINAGRDGLFLGDVEKVVMRLKPLVSPALVVYVLSEADVEEDTQLPGFHIVVDPVSGRIVDASMAVEGKEGFKDAFGPLLHHSALATRLASQLQPSAATAADLIARWNIFDRFGSASASIDAVAPSLTRPPPDQVLEFVFHRLAQHGSTALLYVNGLHYFPDGHAVVADTSSRAEAVARKAAVRAGVPFNDTAAELIESVKRTGQPPFGFNNGLKPGGHLNAQGHHAVAAALIALVRDAAATLPAECGAP